MWLGKRVPFHNLTQVLSPTIVFIKHSYVGVQQQWRRSPPTVRVARCSSDVAVHPRCGWRAAAVLECQSVALAVQVGLEQMRSAEALSVARLRECGARAVARLCLGAVALLRERGECGMMS